MMLNPRLGAAAAAAAADAAAVKDMSRTCEKHMRFKGQ